MPAAQETIQAHQSPQHITLYAFAFSPFVHRAWLALEYLHIPYKYYEVDPKNKPKELLEISPKGRVPAIIIHSDPPRSLIESAVIVEYLENLAATMTKRALLPPSSDPYARALAHLTVDYAQTKGRAWYGVLTAQSEQDRVAAIKTYLDYLDDIADLFDRAERELGPGCRAVGLWNEQGELGYIDVMVGPWMFRAAMVFKHYFGFTFPAESRMAGWVQRLVNDKYFAATLSDDEVYIKGYESYVKS